MSPTNYFPIVDRGILSMAHSATRSKDNRFSPRNREAKIVSIFSLLIVSIDPQTRFPILQGAQDTGRSAIESGRKHATFKWPPAVICSID